METHAPHLHTEGRKKFRHYLYEFLMLFLAIFCGFIAENLREHNVERNREKQYILSLVADLKSDQAAITSHMANLGDGILMMDTLITILNHPSMIAAQSGELYYLARFAPRLNPLAFNDRTFEQLKNSGNFRLIDDLATSNKIMDYYEKFPLVHLLESINETEFSDYKRCASKIFDPAVLLKMEGGNEEIRRTVEDPPLRTTDKELLQELSVFAVYIRGTKNGLLGATGDLKTSGAALIEYLQKHYELQ